MVGKKPVAGLTSKDATACNEIIDRLKQVANVKSDTELARTLGLKQSSVSTAKSNGIIPPSWIVNATTLFDISSDWLIYGDEKHPGKAPKKEQPAPASVTHTDPKNKNDYSKMTAERASDLSLDTFETLWDEYRGEKEGRRGWLQVEVINRFPEFLAWLDKRGHTTVVPLLGALNRAGPTHHRDLLHPPEDD